MVSCVYIATDTSYSMLSLIVLLSNILSCSSIGIFRGDSVLEYFCEIDGKKGGTTSFESWNITLTFPFIIVPRGKKLILIFFVKHNNDNWYWLERNRFLHIISPE